MLLNRFPPTFIPEIFKAETINHTNRMLDYTKPYLECFQKKSDTKIMTIIILVLVSLNE